MRSLITMPWNTPLLFISVCICQNLYADDITNSVKELPTITAEATRTGTSYLNTPASIYRIDMPKQTDNIGVNLTEVVQGIPSLQLNNRQNYAQDLQLSMRGFGARATFGVRGIRIYVDGIPATMPDGQGQTSNIDLNSLDHVEVLTGPFSSLYGNSSGGVLLAETKEGQGKDSITLSYGGGSHNSNHTGLILQGGAKTASQPAYVISSSYFNTDGYRDHSAADKVLNNAKLTWNLDDGSKINWVTNYVKIHAADPMGLTKAQWLSNPKQVQTGVLTYNTRKDLEQTQTGLTWSKPIDDHNSVYAMGYVGNRQVTQYQSIPNTTQRGSINHAGGVIDFDRTYYGADFRWTGKELLPNTTINAGLALDAMDEDRKGYENFTRSAKNTAATDYNLGEKGNIRRNENNTLWNADPYIQASWQFLPTWRVDTGLRYSNVHYKSKDHYLSNGDNSGKTNYNHALPSIALSWKITPNVLAYTSYAKGFETPTFTEMAYNADGSAGFNFALKPSTSDNYEIGLKADNQFGIFALTGFMSKTKNDIVSAGSSNGRATFRNADKTLRQGIEVSWNKKLWKDLTAQASYSYLDATFDADVAANTGVSAIQKGNYIPGVAKSQGFASLGWKPETGFHAGVDVRYMDKIYVNDQNTDTAPSYTVTAIDVGYAYKYKDWSVNTYARVDNLFDKNYIGSVIVNDSTVVNGKSANRYFEPADGRNWSAGLSISKQF
ncbi:TonB-dependent receptor [Acinetobacter sp. ESL0695]|uniref:TonB-dependent receptor n=1 Tax=Acinetobacter sp. ESL0695 TaxID=2983215 RepID=UPI0023F4946F|nr:TonB-dependent receptor [Acinetobacter sp. ESL0695]WEV49475.1 TonB-dependent receptor [Acinetobacter sp. ESL0695]